MESRLKKPSFVLFAAQSADTMKMARLAQQPVELLLFVFRSIHAEFNPRLPSSGSCPHVQNSLSKLVQNTVHFAQYDFRSLPGYFVIHAHELELEAFFHPAQDSQCDQNDTCGKNRRDVKPPTRRHPDAGDNKQRGCRGKSTDRSARMQNRPGANEADARNNLRGYAGMVAAKTRGQFIGKHSKHRGTEANEHVGPQAGRLVMKFPLQSDDAAEDCCHNQPQDRGGKDDSHFLAENVDCVLKYVHAVCWTGFYHRKTVALARSHNAELTCVITGKE